VVDISNDAPLPSDSFLVDTNVWFWVTYTKASYVTKNKKPPFYQTHDYPNYISKALSAGSELYRSGLNLSELSHIIEKKEFEIYQENVDPTIKIKEFRHNLPSERTTTVSEIEVSWNQVKSMSQQHDVTIDESRCCDLLQLIKGSRIDGYDAFITLQEQAINPNFKIITDDGDFSSIPNITVFTSNKSIIRQSRLAGKLIVR
jgi:hypothetical protein